MLWAELKLALWGVLLLAVIGVEPSQVGRKLEVAAESQLGAVAPQVLDSKGQAWKEGGSWVALLAQMKLVVLWK